MRVELSDAYACARSVGENVSFAMLLLVHEDMEASQGDVDALHRYPLSCSVLYYGTLWHNCIRIYNVISPF